MAETIYRRDIDGLRALAVCSVLAFHARYLGGGFTGVDIFFVISGFLISSNIFRELEAGTFSFGDFYARRVRRIFPALICILIFCLAVGYFVLLSDEYEQLGKHVAGGAAYLSNFILWSESGYFDTESEFKLLLHLWSLGIEEQFYLFIPLLLYLLWKGKKNPLAPVCLLLLLSLGSCVFETFRDASAAFYAPWNRFWELMAGIVLAHACRSPAWQSWQEKPLRLPFVGQVQAANLLSVAGLMLLAISVGAFNKRMAFPGLWATVPVLGSMAVIAAGPHGWCNRTLFSNRVAVFIGLISYPAYLWHWVFFSFAHITEGKVDRIFRLIFIALTFLFAWLTYAFVERHLRYGKHGNLKAVALFVCLAALGLIGYGVWQRQGLPERFAGTPFEQAERSGDAIEALVKSALERGNAAFPRWADDIYKEVLLQGPSGENNIVLIGDSHARHLFAGLAEQAGKDGQSVACFYASAATPFLDTLSAARGEAYRRNNHVFMTEAYESLLKDEKVQVVILGCHPHAGYGDIVNVADLDEHDQSVILRSGMRKTLEALSRHNKRVILILDNPLLPYSPRMSLDRPWRFGSKVEAFDRAVDSGDEKKKWYLSAVRDVAKDFPNLRIVDLSDVFCDENLCYSKLNGKVLYLDRGHLNNDGSRLAATAIWPEVMALIHQDN